jgi:hypothetical protein
MQSSDIAQRDLPFGCAPLCSCEWVLCRVNGIGSSIAFRIKYSLPIASPKVVNLYVQPGGAVMGISSRNVSAINKPIVAENWDLSNRLRNLPSESCKRWKKRLCQSPTRSVRSTRAT